MRTSIHSVSPDDKIINPWFFLPVLILFGIEVLFEYEMDSLFALITFETHLEWLLVPLVAYLAVCGKHRATPVVLFGLLPQVVNVEINDAITFGAGLSVVLPALLVFYLIIHNDNNNTLYRALADVLAKRLILLLVCIPLTIWWSAYVDLMDGALVMQLSLSMMLLVLLFLAGSIGLISLENVWILCTIALTAGFGLIVFMIDVLQLSGFFEIELNGLYLDITWLPSEPEEFARLAISLIAISLLVTTTFRLLESDALTTRSVAHESSRWLSLCGLIVLLLLCELSYFNLPFINELFAQEADADELEVMVMSPVLAIWPLFYIITFILHGFYLRLKCIFPLFLLLLVNFMACEMDWAVFLESGIISRTLIVILSTLYGMYAMPKMLRVLLFKRSSC